MIVLLIGAIIGGMYATKWLRREARYRKAQAWQQLVYRSYYPAQYSPPVPQIDPLCDERSKEPTAKDLDLADLLQAAKQLGIREDRAKALIAKLDREGKLDCDLEDMVVVLLSNR